jgi:adenine-specific DNA-methyltransferase
MAQVDRFPPTRFQGSKRKLLPWLLRCLDGVPFSSALDAFSGTAAVAYGLKAMGKEVTCNDQLVSSQRVARALVVNEVETLTGDEAEQLLTPAPGRSYPSFIGDTFGGVYYTDEENRQLDVLVANVEALPPGGQRDLAWFAVFQACLIKRPFNLFHRRNLSLRTADVPRTFGNKATWDTPLAPLLSRFAAQGSAAVFRGARPCRAVAGDVMDAPGDHDLVYMDPPYVSSKGTGNDYARYYHFLEGMCDYASWPGKLDRTSRNLRLAGPTSPWSQQRSIRALLREACARFPDAVLALSYRSDGVPDPEDLLKDLRSVRGEVEQFDAGSYPYVLSTNRRSRELLFIAH